MSAGLAADEFEVAGQTYRVGRLDAIKQLHVVRRLTPVLGSLKGVNLRGAQSGNIEDLTALLGPLADGIAAMSDADTEYVLGTCLGVCQRRQPNGLGWGPVWNAAAGRPQYDDINLPALLQLTAKALVVNVGGFTSGMPQASLTAAAPSPT